MSSRTLKPRSWRELVKSLLEDCRTLAERAIVSCIGRPGFGWTIGTIAIGALGGVLGQQLLGGINEVASQISGFSDKAGGIRAVDD